MTATTILQRDDGYRIAHVLRDHRAAVFDLLQSHYSGAAGNQGFTFAVISPSGDIEGGVLIGGAASMKAERSIINAPYRVVAVKRSYCVDSCPVPESQVLRAAMRAVANFQGQTTMYVSYADPAAVDTRPAAGPDAHPNGGLPLLGWTYLAAGFFFAGHTTSARFAVIDTEGRARSARQGAITLTRRNIAHYRPGWKMIPIPPARIWLAIVPPERLEGRATTQRWRKHQWRRMWSALNPARKIAAKQWVTERAWKHLLQAGQVPLGEPRPDQMKEHQRFQPAWWTGDQLTRTAAPVWVPECYQGTFVDELLIEGERTSGRAYLPRTIAL